MDDNIKKIQLEQEEKLAMQIAKVNNLVYLSPHDAHSLVPIIDKQEAQGAQTVVLKEKEDEISVATKNPKNETAQQLIQKFKQQYAKLNVFVISETTLNNLLSKYLKQQKQPTEVLTEGVVIESNELSELVDENITIDTVQNTLSTISKTDASKALEALLSSAIYLNSTDIHVEPQEKSMEIRVKIDGILHKVATIDDHLYKLVLSRVKLLSDLKLNIHNEAQEGNFSTDFKDRSIEMRVSVLPSQYGEDIAIRILDPKSLLSLEELGIRQDLFEDLKTYLKDPQGLILITGPTGSGKTTTLYACIKFIKNTETKIITIEDPIEYRLDGITQTEVNSDEDYTFANGLVAILRQDPDVLLISELRDIDSAEPALQATLAGRKVFSTLHTIDAAGTAPRLIDMGADPSAVSSALLLSISQRLVRKLCENCKKSRQINSTEYSVLSNILNNLPSKTSSQKLNENSKIYLPNQQGCAQCKGTGYNGRIGIFELFNASKKAKEKILEGPTEDEMRSIMKKQGETNMLQDAVIKILEGITSIEEVERVMGKLEASLHLTFDT